MRTLLPAACVMVPELVSVAFRYLCPLPLMLNALPVIELSSVVLPKVAMPVAPFSRITWLKATLGSPMFAKG